MNSNLTSDFTWSLFFINIFHVGFFFLGGGRGEGLTKKERKKKSNYGSITNRRQQKSC
jgi:hypothetical protein